MGGDGAESPGRYAVREAMPPTRRKEAMRIFVGNLTAPITEEELQQLFEPYGAVKRV
jgi:RNA recognition motif-containing protein